MSKPKASVEDKIRKEFPDFCAEVDRLGLDSLGLKLIQYAKYAEEIQDTIDNSEALKLAKDALAEISGPFNDAKKACRMKMRYIVNMIKEKGGL